MISSGIHIQTAVAIVVLLFFGILISSIFRNKRVMRQNLSLRTENAHLHKALNHNTNEPQAIEEGTNFVERQIQQNAIDLLEQDRSLFKQAEELGNLGYWEWDEIEKKLIGCSEQYARIYDMSVDEVLMHAGTLEDAIQMMHVDDRDRYRNAEAISRHSDTIFDIEYRIITRSGEQRYVHELSEKVLDDGDNLVQSFGTLQDITERKISEQKLRLNQFAIDQSKDEVYWMNKEGNILYASQGAVKRLGYTQKEFLDMKFSDVDPNFKSEKWAEHWNQVKQTGDLLVESRHQTKSGEVFPVEVLIDYFEYEGDEYICSHVRDITERKKAASALQESEERHRSLIENMNHGMGTTDLDGCITYVNNKAGDLFGYPVDELMGKSLLELVDKNDKPVLLSEMEKSKKGGKKPYELAWTRKDGSKVESIVAIAPLFNKDGKLRGTQATLTDITDQKRARENLRESNERFQNSFKYASIGMWIGDKDGIIREANPSTCKMLGYSSSELIGMKLKDITHTDDLDLSFEMHHKLFSGEIENYHLIKQYRHRSGHYIWADVSVALIRNSKGEPDYSIVHVIDITKEKEITEELSYHASHDALTDLVNRREFERRTERLLSNIKIDQQEHALCFLDLDQFKVVNDTCGHVAGDALLKQLSAMLQETVRKRDTLARLGGDEFGILMEHCSLDHAHRVSKTIQKAIQDYHFVWEAHSFRVGASMGLIAITQDTDNLTDLLKNADSACYMAKDAGRNRIHIYHSKDTRAVKRHGDMQWVQRLHQALEEDRFCLYAQSISPLDRSLDSHYELLLRMIDEKGQVILPDVFLPAAELYNIMSKLDAFVVEKTFTSLAEYPDFCRKINFCSINLSGQSLADSGFLDFVIEQITKTGIDGRKICFEITETTAISNLNMAIKFISTLKGRGCSFALDDFGSGLSSFGYLKHLPVDYLKIDGMFVKNIVNDPIDHAMVKSINEIGHVMGMKTIAEFVENDEIKGMLREIGVDYAQGYAVDEPQPLGKILADANNVIDIKNAKSLR